MLRFAANLSMMFTEVPFMDRFESAAKAGFKYVEFLFPYAYAASAIAEKLKKFGLTQALFNAGAGNWDSGERGIGALPGRQEEFAANMDSAITYARALGNTRIHVMSGNVAPGADVAEMERVYLDNIRLAARKFAEYGITVCIEPINHRSMPQVFLHTQAQAARYIAELNEPNVKLQFDFFHAQMEEGAPALKFKEYLPIIGHSQIAGSPERHEPDIGELRYEYIFKSIENSGYSGCIGCEYNPAGKTEAGLGWFSSYQNK
ncbi:MAG: hydroxypyruvate isomerase family protein [Deltaproteobacteria bacterium]|jgi:hydroxypyruvate isomerase|nr:hydroxypyruvate isomerase family protein [Deltaproteobacteria bacterium]